MASHFLASHQFSRNANPIVLKERVLIRFAGSPTRPTADLSLAQHESCRASHGRPGKVIPELCQEMLSSG